MSFLTRIRERIGAVIAAAIGAIALLVCGLLFTLFLAPQQKLAARRIEKIPEMDAHSMNSLTAGEDVLFTGRLLNNPEIVERYDFVAFVLEEWDVTIPDYDPENPDEDPRGNWNLIEQQFPELIMVIGGEEVRTLKEERVAISGQVQEVIIPSNSGEQAKYNGDWLRRGTLRYRGFYNGDLITVLGMKASSGGFIPDEFFAGDRISFVESKHEAAKFMLIAGIAMIVCSPVALVSGVLTAAFRRRKL